MFFRSWLTCSPVLIGLATVACATSPVLARAAETRSATDTQALTQATARARLAGVPDADVQAIIRLAAQHHYPNAATAGFVQQLEQVSRRHLPLDAVRDKILEGIAKQAPAGLITQVADRWAQAVAQAALRVQRIQPLLPLSAGQRATLVNMGALEIHQHGHPYLLDQLATQLPAHRTTDAGIVLKAMQVDQAFMLYGASARQEAQVLAFNLSAANPRQQSMLDQQALALLRAGKPTATVITRLHLMVDRPSRDRTTTQRPEDRHPAVLPHRPAPHIEKPRRSIQEHAATQSYVTVTQSHVTVQTHAVAKVHASVQTQTTVQGHEQKQLATPVQQNPAVQPNTVAQPALLERPEQVMRPEQVQRPELIERPEPIERPERPEIPAPVERPGR